MQHRSARSRWVLPLAFVAFSVGVPAAALGALELSLRLFAPQALRVTEIAGGTLGVEHPTLGHANREGSVNRIDGPEFSFTARIDAEGLRDGSRRAAPAGGARILLVGDSFTFGYGNEYEDSWAAGLERRLAEAGHRVDVVNAGVPGYGTAGEVVRLELLAPRYAPDVAVLGFVFHDLFGAKPVSEATVRALAEKANPAVASGGPRIHAALLLKRLLMQSDALMLARIARGETGRYASSPFPPDVREKIGYLEAWLLRARRVCDARGCAFVVLSIPQEFHVLARARDYRPGALDVDAFDRHMQAFAARNGFAWVPTLGALADAYASGGERLYFRFDGHLNPAGNRVVAAELGRALAERHRERLRP